MTGPQWMWEACSRGHSLRLHGRPRVRGSGYHCRECDRDRYRDKGRYQGHTPDDIVIARVVTERRPEYVHRSEMFLAVARLTALGHSIIETARIAGITPRTVSRMRRKIREGKPYGKA